jgi:hypothetical protein
MATDMASSNGEGSVSSGKYFENHERESIPVVRLCLLRSRNFFWRMRGEEKRRALGVWVD